MPEEEKKEESNDKKQDSEEMRGSEEESETTEMKDRLLRLAAEFDNYKKRMAKEIDGAKNVGKAEAITKLLPTLDEFELAIAALDKEDKHTKGMELVFSNFLSTLKTLGLREIDVDGTFDPYKHEIMLVRESDEKEGMILEVIRKGYILNGIMLRPASVIVSKEKKDDDKKN